MSKIQELDTFELIICIKDYFPNNDFDENETTILNSNNETCKSRTIKSIVEELYKRMIIPFYTLVVSSIGASLIIEPKSNFFLKSHRINIFLLGSFLIALSQISLKYFFISTIINTLIIFFPLFLVIIYYLFLNIFTRFRLNLL